ncbi:MAG: ABC transporter ATP-binding protein [Prevotella sp.]|nr:ABC transporter ATP-binding protein [Prevotella sp.]
MIEIKNMSFKYAGQRSLVFDHFNLRIEENKIYGLLGKNGTGKSTLLYLVAGLLRPTSGSVCCDSVAPSERRAETLREMFLVPEEFELPAMTLKRYVELNAPFYPRFSQERLETCLRDFELDTDLQLQSLSMGQKKKVFMSFALATNTKLLLMDEPTNGLDIPSKSQFRKTVAQNMSDDQTVIISTHQVHDVEALLDHILMMSQRELLLNASVQEIMDKYVFEYRPVDDSRAVVYAEPTLQGNAVMALRQEGQAETQVNLELLFNAVANKRL